MAVLVLSRDVAVGAWYATVVVVVGSAVVVVASVVLVVGSNGTWLSAPAGMATVASTAAETAAMTIAAAPRALVMRRLSTSAPSSTAWAASRR